MYPSSNYVESLEYNTSFLSKGLLEFLDFVLFNEQNSTLKLVAIGQAIIQACRIAEASPGNRFIRVPTNEHRDWPLLYMYMLDHEGSVIFTQ